jgi:hypothetical protein
MSYARAQRAELSGSLSPTATSVAVADCYHHTHTSLHLLDHMRAEQLPVTSFLNTSLTRKKVTVILARHFTQ